MRARDILTGLRHGRRREVTGLVLSGGGSRADFEIGALRYLYDRVGIAPSVIVGTSAGAVLAGILAQSGDPQGQRRLLGRLESIWRGMRTSDEMFTANDWFDIVRRRGLDLADREQRLRTTSPLGHALARVSQRVRPQDQGGPSVGVVEVLATLQEIGRAGPDLDDLVHSMTRERSMYRIGPLMQQLLGEGIFIGSRVATSGVTLRIAAVSLESGEVRYVTENGALVDRQNQPVADGPYDLVDAIRASCAIPAVFEPVQLGEDNYVDGGVRETLPARIAHRHLGVTRCYAVVANPLGVPPETSYAHADLFSVAIRATAEIMTDEGLRDEMASARRDGAVVIAPELNLHDVLTVDPGLTAISMDYGYLRAAEAVTEPGDAAHELIREAMLLRRDIWGLERELFLPTEAVATDAAASTEPHALHWIRAAHQPAPSAADVAEPGEPDLTRLGVLKHRLRDLVARLDDDLLPPGAELWWQSFEQHAFEISVEPTW